MKPARRWKAISAIAAGLALTLSVSACGGSGNAAPQASTDPSAPVELTVATFNEFGYEDLFTEYMKDHPNVTIKHKKAASSNEARDNLTTRLAAGSGLSDVEAIEVDWLPELVLNADKFTDLSDPSVADRWLGWKTKAATAEDGRLIGYGSDIGPEAVCYRADLFKKAGLPTDRDEVAALFGDSWDSYFAAGEKFKAKSDVPFFDTATSNWQGMVNQLQNAYEDNDGNVIATTNPQVKQYYDQVLDASIDKGLSAKLEQWGPDWTKSFQSNGFATKLCPGWMLGVIEGNADGVKGWDVANTFPGGSGNWGGSYLTVPTQSKNAEAAKALANWLTAPEQQLKAFASKGTFPSQVAALSSEQLLSSKDEFFNNAPTGQILAERASKVTIQPYKGEKYFPINDAMTQALTRVESGQMGRDESWKKFVSDVEALG